MFFFFLLRYNVAEYCIVLYKTRLQRCTDSQGSRRSGKRGRARFRTLSLTPAGGLAGFGATRWSVLCIPDTKLRAAPTRIALAISPLPRPLTVILFVGS